MKKKINVALVGSNFAMKGYLPVIINNQNLNLKIICSRNIFKKNNILNLNNFILEKKWQKVFKNYIDLIICVVPPKLQEKIIKYNYKFKKKIIIEKPISSNYSTSKKIVRNIIKKKIKSVINLTFLCHPVFLKLKKIILNKNLGKLKSYDIKWSFVSHDYNKKIKSWKVQEELGGGIKNIFLTHVLSYCEYLFGKNTLLNFQREVIKFKRIKYINKINCEMINNNSVKGSILLKTKRSGFQNHVVEVNFERGKILISNKSKDWSKNFKIKIINHNKNEKIIKNTFKKNYKDGRSLQIDYLINKFINNPNFNNLNYCLNAEKIINRIK